MENTGKKLDLMQSEKQRIEQSIKKITNYNQVIGTLNWIRRFENYFGASGIASNLRGQLMK